MTQPSPELAAVAKRWATMLLDLHKNVAGKLFSQADALYYVGSAEDEIWTGDTLRKGYEAYRDQMPELTVSFVEASAWENGDTGWSFTMVRARFPGMGHDVVLRQSLVFIMEEGSWKIINVHNSSPSLNAEIFGEEYNPLIDLLAAAKSENLQIGKSGSATVMFTDIADSSTLTDAVGDSRWTELVHAHVAQIQTEIEAHDGRLIKSLGDGTMSTFGSAGEGLRTAHAIQLAMAAQTTEPHLQVRIGLHTGDVIEAGNDFFGTVVNKAARVAAVARPGEIRVSDATRIMVGNSPDFCFGDPVQVALKGLVGEHLIFRLEVS